MPTAEVRDCGQKNEGVEEPARRAEAWWKGGPRSQLRGSAEIHDDAAVASLKQPPKLGSEVGRQPGLCEVSSVCIGDGEVLEEEGGIVGFGQDWRCCRPTGRLQLSKPRPVIVSETKALTDRCGVQLKDLS
jgi:hypothetical protein